MEYHNISTIQKNTNWYVNLDGSESITFVYGGQEVTLTPYELLVLLTRTRVLVDFLGDIMDLVGRKDEILNIL